jgi:hypothetical protein
MCGSHIQSSPTEPPHPPALDNSTTSPPNVWFTQVKKLAVGHDIEVLSYANLYYHALVGYSMGYTCSYHILVRLPNLVKPDHKIFVQLLSSPSIHCVLIILARLPNLYKHAH